jgi:hypothetical protein
MVSQAQWKFYFVQYKQSKLRYNYIHTRNAELSVQRNCKYLLSISQSWFQYELNSDLIFVEKVFI